MNMMIKTLKNLKKLIGEEYNYNDVVCAFEDNTEDIIVNDNTCTSIHFDGHGECKLILAYENTQNSIEFEIYVDNNGIIVEVV